MNRWQWLQPLAIPGLCFLAAGSFTRYWLSPYLQWGSAALLLLLSIGFGLVCIVRDCAFRGQLPFFAACRFSYRICLSLCCLLWLGFIGFLLPATLQTFMMLMLHLRWPEFDVFVILFGAIAALVGLYSLLRADPADAGIQPIQLWGQASELESWSILQPVLEQVSDSTGCRLPPNLILGLEPAVLCTRRPVKIGDALLSDGVLYLSLPLCRVMSQSEMLAMIAVELVRTAMAPPKWEAWYSYISGRLNLVRERARQRGNPERLVPLRMLWFWMAEWEGWRTMLAHIGLQRAAIVAGRENTASGAAKLQTTPADWRRFLAGLQSDLRHGQDAGLNLSRRFAEAATPTEDAAIAWFPNAEPMEQELSQEQLKRIFFVK